jgi:hypothetical protein
MEKFDSFFESLIIWESSLQNIKRKQLDTTSVLYIYIITPYYEKRAKIVNISGKKLFCGNFEILLIKKHMSADVRCHIPRRSIPKAYHRK